MKHLLRKLSGALTDNFFLLDIEKTEQQLYCYGKVRKGDYLMTCPIYGVVKFCTDEIGAIAVSLSDKQTNDIGLIEVQWISTDYIYHQEEGMLVTTHVRKCD